MKTPIEVSEREGEKITWIEFFGILVGVLIFIFIIIKGVQLIK
jgi:hypothetical protein